MSEVKLINGDCIKEMQKLIDDGVKVDLVLTDPPYGIDLTIQRGTSKFYGTKVLNDNNLDWLDMWAELIDKISKNIVVVFVGWPTLAKFQETFEKQGFTLKNVLVWDKMWFGMGNNYRPIYELIMLLCKSNFTISSNDKSNILSYKKIAPNKLVHSCEKPIPLLEDLLTDLSNEGDTVLDCFMGSGTTGVACMETNRNFIGIELDPKYYEIAEQRIKEAKAQRRLI